MRALMAAAALIAGLSACGGYTGPSSAPVIAPPPPGASVSQIIPGVDLTPVLSVQAHNNPLYAASTSLFEHPEPDPWDPYIWAENAGALPSLANQPDRQAATKKALLDQLAEHVSGGFVIADHDFYDAFCIVDAPWLSAFSNAVVAIGLLNLGENGEALKYLSTISPEITFADDGYTWFSEYFDPVNNKHCDVMDGHFVAVGALYEYWRRTGDTRFQNAILAGMLTVQHELPLMISQPWHCFLYGRGFPICNYGQLRAVNFAQAGCRIYQPICPEAQVYQELYLQWNPS